MTPTVSFAIGLVTAFTLTVAAAQVGHWLRRRRARGGEVTPTTAGHWECPTCSVEVPLTIAARTIVLELDTTDAELHEMTHSQEDR